LRELGVEEEEIERALGSADEPDGEREPFEIWPENERTLRTFLGLRRQWSVVANAGGLYWQGIRQEAIESALRTRRVPTRDRECMLDELLQMSNAAAAILNERE
jgi:hypothetical protein